MKLDFFSNGKISISRIIYFLVFLTVQQSDNKFIFFFIIYSITLFKVFLLLSSTLIAHTHQSIQSIFIFSFFFRQNHTQHYILWNIRDLWHMMCLVGNQKQPNFPSTISKIDIMPLGYFLAGPRAQVVVFCFSSVDNNNNIAQASKNVQFFPF